MEVEAWKKKTTELTTTINLVINDYNTILNDWEEVRNAAGDPGKHEVDERFSRLSEARDKLCGLKGGSKRKQRRTRKQRR